MNGLTRLFITSFLALVIVAPMAHAQGMFGESAPKEEAAEATENKVIANTEDPAASWTKQQLARAIVEATSPIFTVADVASEAELEKVQTLNAETKNTQQANMEATFTRSELLALYRLYASPEGGSIGAKLGGIQKGRLLEKIK